MHAVAGMAQLVRCNPPLSSLQSTKSFLVPSLSGHMSGLGLDPCMQAAAYGYSSLTLMSLFLSPSHFFSLKIHF